MLVLVRKRKKKYYQRFPHHEQKWKRVPPLCPYFSDLTYLWQLLWVLRSQEREKTLLLSFKLLSEIHDILATEWMAKKWFTMKKGNQKYLSLGPEWYHSQYEVWTEKQMHARRFLWTFCSLHVPNVTPAEVSQIESHSFVIKEIIAQNDDNRR